MKSQTTHFWITWLFSFLNREKKKKESLGSLRR